MPKVTFSASVLQVVPELDTGGVEQTVVDISEAIIAAGGRSIVATKGGRLEERLLKKAPRSSTCRSTARTRSCNGRITRRSVS